MTYDLSYHKRFLAYRAQGETYNQIAAKMNIAKHTLINWAKKYRTQLATLRAIELENLQETFALTQTCRLKILGQQFVNLKNSVHLSDLQRIPPAKRLELMFKIIQLVQKLEIPPDPKPGDPDLVEDDLLEPKPPTPPGWSWHAADEEPKNKDPDDFADQPPPKPTFKTLFNFTIPVYPPQKSLSEPYPCLDPNFNTIPFTKEDPKNEPEMDRNFTIPNPPDGAEYT